MGVTDAGSANLNYGIEHSAFHWDIVYHGGHADGNGLYYLNGREMDTVTDGPLMEDPHAYAAQRYAYSQWTAQTSEISDAKADPHRIAYISGWVSTIAFTLASAGTYSGADGVLKWGLGVALKRAGGAALIGASLGGLDARLANGSIIAGLENGARTGMMFAGGGSLASAFLPATLAWGLGVAATIGTSAYSAKQSFDAGYNLQGVERLGVGLAFLGWQIGFRPNISFTGLQEDGSYVFNSTKLVRFVGNPLFGPQNKGVLYDVGLAKNLRDTGVPYTEAHHVGQSAQAEGLLGEFNTFNKISYEPAIRITESEHDAIDADQGNYSTPTTARELLARDIRLLHNITEAPNLALQDLIRLNKELHYDYLPLR